MLRLVLNSNSFICSFCTTLWIFIIMGICRYMEICILLKIFPASVILHKALHITHIWSYSYILPCSCTIITFIACYQSTVHFQFFYAGGRNSFRNHPPFILERLVCWCLIYAKKSTLLINHLCFPVAWMLQLHNLHFWLTAKCANYICSIPINPIACNA